MESGLSEGFKVFLLISILLLILKGERFIFVLLSLEILVVSALFYFSSGAGESLFIILVVFSVLSSVTGVVVMVSVIASYGEDFVIF